MEVWKFPLENRAVTTKVEMPAGAQVLRVGVQHGEIQLWALVDPDAPKEARAFEVYGTGHEIKPGNLRFISTFFVQGGIYVFHAFERLQ